MDKEKVLNELSTVPSPNFETSDDEKLEEQLRMIKRKLRRRRKERLRAEAEDCNLEQKEEEARQKAPAAVPSTTVVDDDEADQDDAALSILPRKTYDKHQNVLRKVFDKRRARPSPEQIGGRLQITVSTSRPSIPGPQK